MPMTNSRKIEKLDQELDKILEEATGKSRAQAEQEKPNGYEDIKAEVLDLLNLTRLKIETLSNRNKDGKDRDDQRMERDVESNLGAARKLLENMEQQIQIEAPRGIVKYKLFKEQFFCWKVGSIANGDEQPSQGWPTWLSLYSELSEFDHLSGSQTARYASLDSFSMYFNGQVGIQDFFYYCDMDGDNQIGAQDFCTSRKEVRMLVNKCRGLILLKKQIDFLDYKHKPHRFRRNQKNQTGYTVSNAMPGGNAIKPKGRAAQALAARRKKASSTEGNYRPVEPDAQEQAFLDKSAQWEEQLNVELEEIVQQLKLLQVIAGDVQIELDEQQAIMEELDDRMETVDKVIGVEIARLQELLDKSGGMSKWCPRIIAGVIALAILGYLLKSGEI